MSQPNQNSKANNMSFLEHLEALRWLLMRVVIAILVVAIVVFAFRQEVFEKIVFAPLHLDFFTYEALCSFTHKLHGIMPDLIDAEVGCFSEMSIQVIAPKMTTQFMTAMLVSIIGGVIIAFPYIIFELWRFIKPALYSKEQKRARGIVFFTSILFIAGVLFGYYLIAPLSIHFLGTFQIVEDPEAVKNLPSINSYMGIVASTTLASGVMFELPILVYFLSRIGMLTPEFMKKYRKHAFVITLLLAAIITPPDVFSQVLVSIPIVILYEISIFISRGVNKKRR